MRKSIIIISALVVLLIIPLVQAQNEQGLTWGVTEDRELGTQ